MPKSMISRVTLPLMFASLFACGPAFSAPPAPGSAAPAPGPASKAPPPAAQPQAPPAAQTQPSESKSSTVEANKEAIVPDDTSASRNAARTRMRECGHQWSGMKKSGAASGLTWKEFSQSCLARK